LRRLFLSPDGHFYHLQITTERIHKDYKTTTGISLVHIQMQTIRFAHPESTSASLVPLQQEAWRQDEQKDDGSRSTAPERTRAGADERLDSGR